MIEFEKIGRLPAAEDNCAVAIRTLAAGTETMGVDGTRIIISQPVLEGHRFAVRVIPAGAPLLSWGMTFGRALRDIAPGEYVCNAGVLEALSSRTLDFDDSADRQAPLRQAQGAVSLPDGPNFVDDLAAYQLDAGQLQPAPALPREPGAHTFMGVRRPRKRGVGTRNMIVLLGVSAPVSGFVRQLEKEVQPLAERYAHIDGIVAVTHTEGSQAGSNNEALLLRTLAGFMVHPNVAAVLVLDAGVGVLGSMLTDYAKNHGYPLDDVPHRFLSLRGPFAVDMLLAKRMVECLLPRANEMHRSAEPLGELKIALQCGGSDAFSGISGNPLAALVSKEVIQAGGSAVLAETDELIGAESYVLHKVRDAATAERFLAMVARFEERAAWHGHSAHGNPTGGNKYRGLYNIYLKSLGAAAKRHPDVRLDQVIDYGERLREPGYYFMDSPGNDLESIAGQVASGCNLIFFVTGNGSITNFPFVPTIKIVTTSARYALLAEEMDVNAGAYLDGTPLAELAETTRDLSLAVASGQRSAGEKAGHAQVQIWRNWPLSGGGDRDLIAARPRPDGRPLSIRTPARSAGFSWQGVQRVPLRQAPLRQAQGAVSPSNRRQAPLRQAQGAVSLSNRRQAPLRQAQGAVSLSNRRVVVSDRVGLILPASLCAGQIARLAAQRLNQLGLGKAQGISRFAALVHTEGCGGSIEAEFVDTMLGYLAHPLAAASLVLEHGCEISHNDFWRLRMREAGLNPKEVGWASVQLDGGIERVLANIEAWFTAECQKLSKPEATTAGFSAVRLGIMAEGDVDQNTAFALATLSQQIASAGGAVILPANDPLVVNDGFVQTLPMEKNEPPTTTFAQRVTKPGFHLMANTTSSWSETMTGLGAAGVELIMSVCSRHAQQSHPFIPVLQVASQDPPSRPFHADMDLLLAGDAPQRMEQLLAQLSAVLSRTKTPKAGRENNISFQITRGQLGVSL